MSSDSQDLAANVISYIGIPLAVLGVIPVFYTSINSIVTAYNIKRKLKNNDVIQAATRSSMLSGVVEVEMSRMTLSPLDRDDPEYWTINKRPSKLKGGTWRLLNWNKLVTGRRHYRVQYSADTQEPQAEVDFDELLSFLIDRGAVPDAKGFRLLNMAGLWTPSNTVLLQSPDQQHPALRIAFPEDSDGMLSLVLNWDSMWDDMGEEDKLPPHWIRLKDHRLPKLEKKADDEAIDSERPSEADPSSSREISSGDEKLGYTEKSADSTISPASSTTGDKRLPNYTEVDENSTVLRIHLGMRDNSPIINAVMHDSDAFNSRLDPSKNLAPSHLQNKFVSQWLPVFATAFGVLNGASIWTIHLPTELVALSARDAVPCGVLEFAGILTEGETPPWATEYDPKEDHREWLRRISAKRQARSRERALPPDVREAEASWRRRQELRGMMQEEHDQENRQHERAELREREAIMSERIATEKAAKGVLRKLKKADSRERGGNPEDENDKENRLQATEGPWRDTHIAAETILFTMVREEKTANDICSILDRWSVWVERGGMNKEDFKHVMQKDARPLCYAIILMTVLKEESGKQENSLAVDLQECVKTWKRIRLG